MKSFMIKRWNFRKNRAAFFETGHSEAGKRGESGILSSNTTFTTFTSFRSPPAKKSWVKLSYFLCEGHFPSRRLTWVFHLTLKLAATPPQKSWKPCASWSPVLRMTRQVSIDVALFVGVAETKDVSMVAATLQPMPVKAVAAWRIFGGGSGETFLDEKSKMSAWRRVVIIAMYFLTVVLVSSKWEHRQDVHLML